MKTSRGIAAARQPRRPYLPTNALRSLAEHQIIDAANGSAAPAEFVAVPLVGDDRSGLRVAAKQAGAVRTAVAKRREKQHIVVAAWDDEVHVLPRHDFDQPPFEFLGIGNRLGSG
jgi:hypothetical protein